MNKKFTEILSLLLVSALIFVFVGCSGNKNIANITLPEGKTTAEVGDIIKFGTYEQDNDTSNGKEEIEWLVLDKKDGRILVISKYALDCKPYNNEYEDVTWETCTLRKWLNDDFINSAFSTAEKAVIPTVTVSGDYEYVSTDASNAIGDQVFLLSETEANQYFESDDARECEPTEYAVANGAEVSSGNGNCRWWLRSLGYRQDHAADVDCGGNVNEGGEGVYVSYDAVRPAMWINLE